MSQWETDNGTPREATRGLAGVRSRRPRRAGPPRLGRCIGGGLALAAAGLALLALAGVWNPLAGCFRIHGVAVIRHGPGVLDLTELQERLPVGPGSSFLDLDRALIQAELKQLPRVAQVRVSYAWFQRLMVEVTERAAMAMVVLEDGRVLEVACDGVLLPLAGEVPADLPLITWEGQTPREALRPGDLLDLRGVPDVMELLVRLRGNRPTLWQGISEAHFLVDGTCEFFWNDIPTVAWLRGKISDMRLHAWASVMGDLRARGELDAVVDLRFRDQIVVCLPAGARTAPRNAG